MNRRPPPSRTARAAALAGPAAALAAAAIAGGAATAAHWALIRSHRRGKQRRFIRKALPTVLVVGPAGQ